MLRLLGILSCAITIAVAKQSPFEWSECPNSCFCEDNYTLVSCVGDGLWPLPLDIPVDVRRLELRSFVLKTLSASMLSQFRNVTEMKIQQTQLTNLQNHTFVTLRLLERLDLSQNQIRNISDPVFQGLENLKYLDLSSNRLETLISPFLHLTNLEHLNLRNNHLQVLSSTSLEGLVKLRYLNLDSNHIGKIEMGTFQYVTNLAHLLLSDNPLFSMTRVDFFGSKLQYIDISSVGLTHIPQSLTRFIRDLRLAKNNISKIHSEDFDSYPYLSLLVMDDNGISEVEPDALGRQEYLVRLWLSGNRLTTVPERLPQSLKSLYIVENRLQSIKSLAFEGLQNLEQLFLQRNQINHIDSCGFCDLVNLKVLDLQSNDIRFLERSMFVNLTALETLDLSHNPIQTIGTSPFTPLKNLKFLQLSRLQVNITVDLALFSPLKKLKTLDVHDSQALAQIISNSTHCLHALRGLQDLDLSNNNLTTVRKDLPSFLGSIRVLRLAGNLWNCSDSSVVQLVRWIQNSDVQFPNSYGVKCAYPDQLSGKPVILLTEGELLGRARTTSPPASVLETWTPPLRQTALPSLANKTHLFVSSLKVINQSLPHIAGDHYIVKSAPGVSKETGSRYKFYLPVNLKQGLPSTQLDQPVPTQRTRGWTSTTPHPSERRFHDNALKTPTSIKINKERANLPSPWESMTTPPHGDSDDYERPGLGTLNWTGAREKSSVYSEGADSYLQDPEAEEETNQFNIEESVMIGSHSKPAIKSQFLVLLAGTITIFTGIGFSLAGIFILWRRYSIKVAELDERLSLYKAEHTSVSYSPHRDNVSISTLYSARLEEGKLSLKDTKLFTELLPENLLPYKDRDDVDRH